MTRTMNAITKRRLANFRANKRAFWSLWIFLVLFVLSLLAEFIANDKPIYVRYQGQSHFPIFSFYSEYDFGGDYQTEADYRDPIVACLIRSGGEEGCFDDTEIVPDGDGKIIWPIVPYHFLTVDKNAASSLQPPSSEHWFGTDGQSRDVFARVLYGYRITIAFALIVSILSSVIGIVLGAIMGYFGGRLDLLMQRVIEIWSTLPTLYVIIILAALIPINFVTMVLIVIAFSWTGLVNLVRAEFLRARNFEYVRAARAMGVGDRVIMFRHVLPNAMVATITYMPFIITGAVGTLATLDFFNFGLPANYPSLGELAREAYGASDQAVWLIWAAFISYTVLLSLLIFIFEGVRDAFDPRKVFA